MSYERFTLTRPGPGVALVTIDRADKLNAMDPLFFEELIAVTDELSRDPDVRAAVLTGAGRAFSAGGTSTASTTWRATPHGCAPTPASSSTPSAPSSAARSR